MGAWSIELRILYLGTSWMWSASRPGRFISWGRAPGPQWIGGWVRPSTGPDELKNSYEDSNSEQLAVQLVASRYTDRAKRK
jgi:hypothetical protein